MAELNASLFASFTGIEVNDRSSNSFTISIFKSLFAVAEGMLNKMLSGTAITEDLHNYALALMIAHLWTIRTTDNTLKSESIGTYSYSRDTDKSTKYMAQLEEMIASLGASDSVMFVSVEDTKEGDVDGLLRV